MKKILSIVINIIFLSYVSYLIAGASTMETLKGIKDPHLILQLRNYSYWMHLIILSLIYVIQFLIFTIFKQRHSYNTILLQMLIGFVFIWYFSSLYYTYNINLILADPFKKHLFISITIVSIILPFSEWLLFWIFKVKRTGQRVFFDSSSS